MEKEREMLAMRLQGWQGASLIQHCRTSENPDPSPGMCVCVSACMHAQLCSTLCDPMDCSSPGVSVHGIFQGRILEWVAISYSRDLSDSGIEPTSLVSLALGGRFFTVNTTWEVPFLLGQQVYSWQGSEWSLCCCVESGLERDGETMRKPL